MFRHFERMGPEGHHGYGEGRHWGRHGGWGRGRGEGGPFGRGGFGGGRERMFDGGELKLAILHLLNEQPSYGYQLIKRLEEQMGGGYTPSPGVIYPTLTMLEEEGLAEVTATEGGKKVYSLTEEGRKMMTENKRRLEEMLERMKQAGSQFQRGRSPEIMRAFMNLGSAVRARASRSLTEEQVRKIAEAIDAAAKAIDEL